MAYFEPAIMGFQKLFGIEDIKSVLQVVCIKTYILSLGNYVTNKGNEADDLLYSFIQGVKLGIFLLINMVLCFGILQDFFHLDKLARSGNILFVSRCMHDVVRK